MGYTYSFEKLEVWQLAREFAKDIYRITQTFPDYEKFGLANQMRRAAISVSSNLAEGSARKTQKDQARFTQLSYSSLMEVLNQLIIASDFEYCNQEQLQLVREKVEKLSNKINALYSSQLRK